MPLLPEAKNVDISVRKNFRRISKALGYTASPQFVSITLTDLTTGSVIFVGTGGILSENNSAFNWSDANGRLDITDTLRVKDSSGNVIFYANNDEMYFTAAVEVPIAAGVIMGPWLFWFTYASP